MRASGSRLISIGRPLLVWTVLLLSVFMLSFNSNISGALRISRRRAETLGTVFALETERHRTVVVTYEVNGKTYKTSTSLPESIGLPSFENLRIGDRVRVEYDADCPALGVPGSAERILQTNLGDLAALGLFLGIPTAIVEFRIRRYLKNRDAQPKNP